jgi:hypothetical protein
VRGVLVVVEEVGVRGREQPRGGLPDMGRNIHPGHDAKAGEIGQHDALGRHGGFDDLFLGGVQCGRTLVRHAKPRMTGRRLARRERGGKAGRVHLGDCRIAPTRVDQQHAETLARRQFAGTTPALRRRENPAARTSATRRHCRPTRPR